MSTLAYPNTPVGNAIKVSTNAIQGVSSSKSFDAAGALVVQSAAPVPIFFVNGLPFAGTGPLFIVDKAAAVPPLVTTNGLQYDASSAVVTVDTAAAALPLSQSCGLIFDASGALVTSA